MARRDRLDNLTKDKANHAGLWLDRYLEFPPKAGNSERQLLLKTLVADAAGVAQSTIVETSYQPVYRRWVATLKQLGAQTATVTTTYRLAAGHGRESVIETGLTLHHTYGVPIIPGSSLKGAAAAYARERLDEDTWGVKSDAYQTLFGTTGTGGYVTFLDALPVAGEWTLLPDVLTVHHRGYYQGQGDPPADWDDPTPIPFLSVRGQFLLAVLPQTGATRWAERALELLKMAVAEMGVGGKTSSGYGRLA